MVEYRISMERSSGLSDAQLKSRLSRVYTLLITLARRAEERETADGEAGNQAQLAASDTRAAEHDATGSI